MSTIHEHRSSFIASSVTITVKRTGVRLTYHLCDCERMFEVVKWHVIVGLIDNEQPSQKDCRLAINSSHFTTTRSARKYNKANHVTVNLYTPAAECKLQDLKSHCHRKVSTKVAFKIEILTSNIKVTE